RGRIPDAIRQAYCIVVVVSDKNEVQAFKITVTDDSHFNIIKCDKRSRIQDTAITSDALLPDGPYNLWHSGETSRRVKDLAESFAQHPHLPKMLQSSAILETLAEGCFSGIFVLKLTRPDRSIRTWWMARPDEVSLKDSALELVLPESAELTEINPRLLAPKALPGIWQDQEITYQSVLDYFIGGRTVQIDRGSYQESLRIPKVGKEPLDKSITAAVENGSIWLLSGPASILGEPVPSGVLSAESKLCLPIEPIAPAELLNENIPNAWADGTASALSILTALSVKIGKNLPWKVVCDALQSALQARFVELTENSHEFPCGYPAAQNVWIRAASSVHKPVKGTAKPVPIGVLFAESELEPSQIQDLSEIIPQLLSIKTKINAPLKFHVRIELGDGRSAPDSKAVNEFNELIAKIKDGWKLH
ncbi:MAG: hypothetical protein PHQ23_08815, partial [Candidatus Wallbacteria bacterium]|nr:hypothetical protein [Candidatus Wallbacteria bacterium]